MASDGKGIVGEAREEYMPPRKVSITSVKDGDAVRHGDRALAIMYGTQMSLS